MGGEFDVAGVGEVEAVVAGGGDEDNVGLGGGVGDAVEGGFEACAVSGGEVGGGADGERDDIGAVGDGVFDALHDPAEQAAGFAGGALLRRSGRAGDGRGHALEDFDVEDGGGRGYSDDLSSAGADGGGGEGGSPGAMSLLVLRGAVIAGAGVGGLVDFGEVQGEIGGDVGMGLVDAAVDDGDADAFAHGGVPWSVRGAAGDVVAVAADLLDGPSLRCVGVVGVVGWRRWRGWWRGKGRRCGDDGTVGGEPADGGGRVGRLSGDADAGGGRHDALEAQAVGGDDTIVQDEVDVRLGGQAAKRTGVVFLDCGLDGGDAEVIVAPGEVCAGGGDAGFGVTGDGRVAIEDEVAVGCNAAGVDLGIDLGMDLGTDLGAGETGKKERQSESSPEVATADRRCNLNAKSRCRKKRITVNGHGVTSLLRCGRYRPGRNFREWGSGVLLLWFVEFTKLTHPRLRKLAAKRVPLMCLRMQPETHPRTH